MSSRKPTHLPLVLAGLAFAGATDAQSQEAPRPTVAASGRVETSVSFDGRLMADGSVWLNRSTSHSGPARISIDYGQPHARGRVIFGDLVPYGQVWRLGANMATHLTTDLDIRLGGLSLERGVYSLYLLPDEDGAALIVNRKTRQWGTEYDPSADVGRATMQVRALAESIESLTVTIEPAFPPENEALPTGTLRIAWGGHEYSVPWEVTFPR